MPDDDPAYRPSANPLPGSPPPPPPVPPPPVTGAMPVGGTAPGAFGAVTDTTTGLPRNVAAGLAVLFSFVSGIIFLVLEKRSQFVRFWAMQSVIVGGALFAFNVVSWILGLILAAIPLVGWIVALLLVPLSIVVWLAALVLYVIMLIKAFTGEEWNVPYVGKIAREQLAKLPV